MKFLIVTIFLIISNIIYPKSEIYLWVNCIDNDTNRKIELNNFKIFDDNKVINFDLKEDGILVLDSNNINHLIIEFLDYRIDFGKNKKLKQKKYIELNISIHKEADKKDFEIRHHLGHITYVLNNCAPKSLTCNKIDIKTPTQLIVNKEGILELYNANKAFNKYIELN